MFTIAFNSFEKQKLLEILSKDNSKESQEFINRVNNCCGFYWADENGQFNYYGQKVNSEYPLVYYGNFPSGIVTDKTKEYVKNAFEKTNTYR